MNRPRILIADDHRMFAQGLAGLLEDEFELIGMVENGEALLERAAQLDPDLVLVDISMPVLNGLDAVRRLGIKAARTKIIILTMHADSRLVAEALRCGASGYVLKQSAGEDLIHAIREVMSGKTYVTPLMGGSWQEKPGAGEEKPELKLTPRQREVLQLLCRGCTMKQIAGQLKISARTAESYKYQMMQDLGVQSTAELIQYAIKLGLTTS